MEDKVFFIERHRLFAYGIETGIINEKVEAMVKIHMMKAYEGE